jgi:hypothetical protein
LKDSDYKKLDKEAKEIKQMIATLIKKLKTEPLAKVSLGLIF